VLRNVGFVRFRIQPVATNHTAQVRTPASTDVIVGAPVNIRHAKEHALAKVAALGATAIPAPPLPAPAQALAAPATPRTTTNTVARPGPARTSPPTVDLKALMIESRDLYRRKQFDDAAVKARKILDQDPENIVGLTNLAVIRFQQKRLEEAEHLFNRALVIAPDDAYCHATIGIIYFKQDRINDTIAELTRSIKLDPNNAEAHSYLGIACWKKGWSSAAEQELHRAVEIRPDYAEAHHNLALIYTSKALPFPGLAKFHYRKTLALGWPRDPDLENIFEGKKAEKPPESGAKPVSLEP
jgi:tetratricopeptide (TPR) repeat protein